MKVKGKKIIVTGAGSGMGRELALQLIDKGASVIAIDLNTETLEDTANLAGGKDIMSIYTLDISKKDDVESLVKQLLEEHKSIDGLINNAGIIQPFVRVNDLDYEAIERVMNVNFYGSLYLIKALLPHLMSRPDAHIMNVSSMGGFLPVPGQSVYGASKAAIKLLSEGLREELVDTNVGVTVIFPGAVATNITENSGVDSPIQGEPTEEQSYKAMPADRAAEKMIRAMEKNKARVNVGKDSKMMSIFYRISPSWATGMITKRMKDLLK